MYTPWSFSANGDSVCTSDSLAMASSPVRKASRKTAPEQSKSGDGPCPPCGGSLSDNVLHAVKHPASQTTHGSHMLEDMVNNGQLRVSMSITIDADKNKDPVLSLLPKRMEHPINVQLLPSTKSLLKEIRERVIPKLAVDFLKDNNLVNDCHWFDQSLLCRVYNHRVTLENDSGCERFTILLTLPSSLPPAHHPGMSKQVAQKHEAALPPLCLATSLDVLGVKVQAHASRHMWQSSQLDRAMNTFSNASVDSIGNTTSIMGSGVSRQPQSGLSLRLAKDKRDAIDTFHPCATQSIASGTLLPFAEVPPSPDYLFRGSAKTPDSAKDGPVVTSPDNSRTSMASQSGGDMAVSQASSNRRSSELLADSATLCATSGVGERSSEPSHDGSEARSQTDLSSDALPPSKKRKLAARPARPVPVQPSRQLSTAGSSGGSVSNSAPAAASIAPAPAPLPASVSATSHALAMSLSASRNNQAARQLANAAAAVAARSGTHSSSFNNARLMNTTRHALQGRAQQQQQLLLRQHQQLQVRLQQQQLLQQRQQHAAPGHISSRPPPPQQILAQAVANHGQNHPIPARLQQPQALSSTQVSQQRLSHIPRFPAVAAAARLPISSTEGVAASRLAGPAAATGLASTAAGPRHTSNNAAGLRTASQTGSPPLSNNFGEWLGRR